MNALLALALAASLTLTPALATGALAAPAPSTLASMQLSAPTQQLALSDEQKAAAIRAGGGTDPNADFKGQFKDPMLRGLFSFVLPGAGQWFNSDEPKDWWHLGIAIALPIASGIVVSSFTSAADAQAVSNNSSAAAGTYLLAGTLSLALTLVDLGWHVYSGLDAYHHADKNQPGSTKVRPSADE